jgi:hypothetical protein
MIRILELVRVGDDWWSCLCAMVPVILHGLAA